MDAGVKKSHLLLLTLLMALIASCHSEYVVLDYSTHHGACWNSDSTKIGVIISSTAYRQPKGISRFPDGGRVKYEFQKTALYIFSPNEHSLREVDDFSDLANLIGTNRSTWNGEIDFRDTILYYQIDPVLDWDFLKRLAAKNEKKLEQIPQLKEKYKKTYQIKLSSGTKSITDTTKVQGLFTEIKRANLTKLNRELKNVPLSEMGLVLNNFHKKSDRKLIEETIYLDNKSATTRRAVFEQIISELNKEELDNIMNRMGRHKSKLSELEKERYEKDSKELYENIKALL